MGNGNIYVISAPSGAGKTSLIDALCTSIPSLDVSISYTTREPRLHEKNGQHYHFLKMQEFEELLAQDEWLEYANVFGNYYGTSKTLLNKQLKNDIDVLLELDWQGAQQIRTILPKSTSIFILPPSKMILKERLKHRGTDTSAIVERRLAEATKEISHYAEYDYLIINDIFDTALLQLKSIIQCHRLTRDRQYVDHHALIQTLLNDDE
ncbi:MAG: guanylate kinase [Endozoicomonadaceae bacterium]|nr:guanylate kinase [Endozoicomonadaceae bacterium]